MNFILCILCLFWKQLSEKSKIALKPVWYYIFDLIQRWSRKSGPSSFRYAFMDIFRNVYISKMAKYIQMDWDLFFRDQLGKLTEDPFKNMI